MILKKYEQTKDEDSVHVQNQRRGDFFCDYHL